MAGTRKTYFLIRILVLLCLAAALPGGIAAAAPGDTTRVSVSSSGAQGNDMSRWAQISGDGNYVAFESYASNLVSGDTNGEPDIFVYNRQTRVTERVSVADDESQANGWSESDLAISRDGRYVAFGSVASNLVSGDTNSMMDVFVRDRLQGRTIRVSVDSNGAQVTGDPSFEFGGIAISGDGRFVTFTSEVSTLVNNDTNGVADAFVHDLQTGATIRVSVSSSSEQGNGYSASSDISDDGHLVVFGSSATNLVSGDTNGVSDVFVHNLLTDETRRVSISSIGDQANRAANGGAISDNGRFVAFSSEADNLAPNYEIWEHVYIHDLETWETTRVSVWADGSPMVGWAEAPAISADGRYVAFEWDDRGDGAPVRWIYVRDRGTGQTIMITRGDSEGQQSPFNPSLSADGRFLSFDSGVANLVSGDTNGVRDVFVREGPFASTPIPTATPSPLPTATPLPNPVPTVVSINRLDANPAYTWQNVRYAVLFSEAVTGVDTSDFVLARTGNTGAAAITGVSGSGSSYTVTVTTGSGQGAIRLDLIDNDSIRDNANQPLGGAGNGSFSGGQIYNIIALYSTIYRSNGTNDGWVLESGEDTNQGGSLNATNYTFYLGDNAQDRQFRAVLHFPTYTLPDNAVIVQAVLKLKKQSVYGTDPFTTHQNILVDIRYGPFSGSNDLQLADFQAPASRNAVATVFNTPSGDWYSAALDAAAFPSISLIGVTQFRLAFQRDDNDDLGADTIQFYSGDYSDLAYRPQLQILYYVP